MPTMQELTKGLTPAQKKAFLKLVEHGGYASAYDLGVWKIETMDILVRKGLAKMKPGHYHLYSQETEVLFKSRYRKVSGK